MLRMLRPMGHATRITLLRRAVWAGNEQKEGGALAVEPALLEQMVAQLSAYEANRGALKRARITLTEALQARNRASSALTSVVRQFFTVLSARTQRLKHDPVTLDMFGMVGGLKPTIPSNPQALVLIAEGLIAGETMAVGKELPAMVNPGVEEVQTLTTETIAAIKTAERARYAYNRLLEESRTHAATASNLTARLARRLRVILEDKSPAEKRECMRYFGYRFVGDPKPEEVEEQLSESGEPVLSVPESVPP